MPAFNLYTCSICSDFKQRAQKTSAFLGCNTKPLLNALYFRIGILATVVTSQLSIAVL